MTTALKTYTPVVYEAPRKAKTLMQHAREMRSQAMLAKKIAYVLSTEDGEARTLYYCREHAPVENVSHYTLLYGVTLTVLTVHNLHTCDVCGK